MIVRFALAMLAAAFALPASAQLGEGQPLAIAQSYTVSSRVLEGDRIISVRLPAAYEAEPEREFPVVYLLDGGPDQDFVHIAGIAQSGDVNYSFEPFILVGIQSTQRRHFFAPPVADPAPYEEMLQATPGGTAQYREFLRTELKPLIEASYRTNGSDAIIGESLAALFVVETLMEEPTLFDDYIAVSPSLWWEQMTYGKRAAEYLAKMPAGERRLYLTTASEGDWHREGTERLVSALRTSAPDNLKWTFVDAGASETHGTLFHPMALDAFRVLFASPAREYTNYPLVGGPPLEEPTEAQQKLLDTKCDADNSLSLTPGAAERSREAIVYECLIYQLGPLPREGNLPG